MVDINWPDISQNQLMHVGLGLLGSGFGRGQTNPYLAAAQGLSYGSQADAFSEEQRRLKAEEDRRAAAQARWEAMFTAYGAGGGSDLRSEESRVGRECVRKGRSRWWLVLYKKQQRKSTQT